MNKAVGKIDPLGRMGTLDFWSYKDAFLLNVELHTFTQLLSLDIVTICFQVIVFWIEMSAKYTCRLMTWKNNFDQKETCDRDKHLHCLARQNLFSAFGIQFGMLICIHVKTSAIWSWSEKQTKKAISLFFLIKIPHPVWQSSLPFLCSLCSQNYHTQISRMQAKDLLG